MSEYLTPEEVQDWAYVSPSLIATLREYAEIVEAVAGMEEAASCPFCGKRVTTYVKAPHVYATKIIHASDCIYLRARKVRGYE